MSLSGKIAPGADLLILGKGRGIVVSGRVPDVYKDYSFMTSMSVA